MKIFTLFLIAFILFKNSSSFSQLGTLDSSFGINGKMIKPEGSANAVAVAPNGKIIAAGSSSQGFTLVRYKSNGFIDKSFGVNGIATADFGVKGVVNSIVITTGGKIIAAGTDGKDFAIAKFNANGTLDSSFGINGKVTTDFHRRHDYATFVTVDSDNNIIAVGTHSDISGEAPSIAVVRYKPDGTPDSSFSHDARLSVGGFGFGSTLILQPDKKIIVIGTYIHEPAGFDFVLARYRSNGTLDKTFGTDGFAYTDFDDGEDHPVAAAVQSNGKIVVAGSTGNGFFGSDHTIDLARYTINGRLDSTFARGGKIATNFGTGHDACKGMVIQSDDKIIVAGNGGGIEIARFTKNGVPDRSFGGDGSVNIDSTSDESIHAVTLQDGKIIAAGSSLGNFLIARLNNDSPLINVIADNSTFIQEKDLSVKLYPNPASDFIYITGVHKGSAVSIFNEAGTLLMKAVSKTETCSLHINQLPQGVYYLSIEEKSLGVLKQQKITTIKFIKE